MANKIQNAFGSIKADPALIESTKQFITEKSRTKTRLFHRPVYHRMLALASIMLILFVGFSSYSFIQKPVSYVSIDVNPSIELGLNRFDKVVSMTAYNGEGEEILEGLSLNGKTYTDAIDMIVESEAMSMYLTDTSELVFTVASDRSREKELKKGVDRCSGHIGHSSQSVSTDIEIVSQAHEEGLSLGKYYAYLQLNEYDENVTVDVCRDMSMDEIHSLISEHEQDGTHNQNKKHKGSDDVVEGGNTTPHQKREHHQKENH